MKSILRKFSKRKGTSDDDGGVRGIVWILLYFDHSKRTDCNSMFGYLYCARQLSVLTAWRILRVSRDACNSPALLFFAEICIGIDDSLTIQITAKFLSPETSLVDFTATFILTTIDHPECAQITNKRGRSPPVSPKWT